MVAPNAPHSTGPPDAVLATFGATDAAKPIPGGTDRAWRSGDLVFKRSDASVSWLAWEERVLHVVRAEGFRVQQLHRARGGALSVDGWVARTYVAGEHRSGCWRQIIEAGAAFHAAVAELPAGLVSMPSPPRTDAWAMADRVAWGEQPMPTAHSADDPALAELMDARRPVHLHPQLIHGDLTGNVLFADGLDPGIIDFSPYWRPTGYAIGVVVADAIVWEGADLSLVDQVADLPEMGQCLVRALLCRHVTALLLHGRLPTGEAAARYATVRLAAISLATG